MARGSVRAARRGALAHLREAEEWRGGLTRPRWSPSRAGTRRRRGYTSTSVQVYVHRYTCTYTCTVCTASRRCVELVRDGLLCSICVCVCTRVYTCIHVYPHYLPVTIPRAPLSFLRARALLCRRSGCCRVAAAGCFRRLAGPVLARARMAARVPARGAPRHSLRRGDARARLSRSLSRSLVRSSRLAFLSHPARRVRLPAASSSSSAGFDSRRRRRRRRGRALALGRARAPASFAPPHPRTLAS